MFSGVKAIFAVFALVVFPFVIYAVRPGQTRPVGEKWWRLGAADPMRRLLYRPDGLPHRHTWLLVTVWFGLWFTLLWFLPDE